MPSYPAGAVSEAGVRVEAQAPQVNARRRRLRPRRTSIPALLEPVADSNLETRLARRRERPGRARARFGEQTLARGTVTRDGQTYAEVAYPLGASVVLLSASLHDQLQVVSRRAPAGLRRRRARDRLRRAARLRGRERSSRAGSAGSSTRPSGSRPGSFDEPVVDHGSDELGQLARSFERMRLRLAHLDRARGEFIANASHELRTPLFSLGGLPRAARRPELDEATRDEFLGADARAGRAADEARHRPARPLAARRRPAHGRAGDDRPRRARRRARRRVPRPRGDRRPPARARRRERRCVALGDAERVLQIGRILVENALVHTPPGHDGAGLDRRSTAAARR